MSYGERIGWEDAITSALRAANDAIGDREPHKQALDIIRAIKALRSDKRVTIPPAARQKKDRVTHDHLERVQVAARVEWAKKYNAEIGPEADATASVDTPLGTLTATVWRQRWKGVRGERIAWCAEYWLAGETITIRDIRAAGLAQRPTTRNRKRKGEADQPAG